MKWDLGIRNEDRQENSMCMPAVTADHSEYAQPYLSGTELESTFIKSMASQASGMSTGTRNGMELNPGNNIIIFSLIKMVAIFCKNGYHGIVAARWEPCGNGGRFRL